MKSKNILILLFFLVVIIQLFVPLKMVYDNEDILETGTEYKFIITPVDPIDPYRGKYLTLQFKDNTVNIENVNEWLAAENIYVVLTYNSKGFAKPQTVLKSAPSDHQNYLKARVLYLDPNTKYLTINYPFDRFYLEESKAPLAEKLYNESLSDTSIVTYALVAIKDGNAVLKDVIVNDTSIVNILDSVR